MRVVLHDALGHGLQHHGLTGARRRDDHRPLPLAERAEQVDHPVRVVRLPAASEATLEEQLFVGVERAEAVELGAARDLLGRLPVDAVDPRERGVLPALRRQSDLADDLVAGAEVIALHQLGRDVHIPVAREVAGVAAAQEPGTARREVEHTEHDVGGHIHVRQSWIR